MQSFPKMFLLLVPSFLLKLFKLGRFQYAAGPYRQDVAYNFNGITVNPGDSVYYIHIPATGSMPEEERAMEQDLSRELFRNISKTLCLSISLQTGCSVVETRTGNSVSVCQKTRKVLWSSGFKRYSYP